MRSTALGGAEGWGGGPHGRRRRQRWLLTACPSIVVPWARSEGKSLILFALQQLVRVLVLLAVAFVALALLAVLQPLWDVPRPWYLLPPCSCAASLFCA